MESNNNFALKGMVFAGSMIAGALLNVSANGTVNNFDEFQSLGSGAELRSELLNQPADNLFASLELKCGDKNKADMKKESSKDAKATESKSKDAKCGEGKCGEGKCGDKEKKKAESKSDSTKSESKSKDHKCGEGKCGN